MPLAAVRKFLRLPPTWGTDSLSANYFESAEHNDRATAANYPEVFALLRALHSFFEKLCRAVENDTEAVRVVPRFLLIRTHSTILAAFRLAMSGQISEAQALNLSAIEQIWYALHIAKDPAGWPRAECWLRRNENDTTLRACKDEFTVRNVRESHVTLDAQTAGQLATLYEHTINFGAHPNQMGVMGSIRRAEEAGRVVFQVGLLSPEPRGVMATVRVSAAVAIGAFKVFQLIYPERFTLVGLDAEIPPLVTSLNTVFKGFSSRTA